MNKEEKRTTPPRGHSKIVEKPKNLKGTLVKLFKSLKKLVVILFVALFLSSLSSVLSIIGPNKLSDLTDEISKGLIVKQDNLTILLKDVSTSFDEEKITKLSSDIIKLNMKEDLLDESNSTIEERMKYYSFIYSMKEDPNNIRELKDCPSSVKELILPSSTYNDVFISTDDKIEFILVLNKLKQTETDKKLDLIKELPVNIRKFIIKDTKIDNKVITVDDKIEFLKLLSTLNIKNQNMKELSNDDLNEIYRVLEDSPKNIKSIIMPKIDINKIKSIAIFLIALYLISAVFNFLQSFLMAILSNTYAKKLRTNISEKINKLPLKYFDKHSKGDILSRVINDVDLVGMNLSQSLGSLVGAITLFIGSLIMMIYTNWIMAITAVVSAILGFIFMGLILGKSQKYFIRRQEELGKLNGHIEEIYTNHNVVKAYNGTSDALEKFEELNKSVYSCNKMSQFLAGLMPSFMHFIGNFGYVCVCIVGALLVMDNKISFGVIVAFMVYIRLFTSPLSQIAQGMGNIQSTCAAAERVFEFIEEVEMEDETNLKAKINKKDAKGNIEFKHVKFGYDENKIVINDFNCKVKKGQKVAIVGPTGAGKTTMVNLLMKFYNILDGDIIIDGKSIKNLTRKNIHDLFVMVLQDTWLFDGTIKDNVKFNNENISDKDVIDALKTVGIYHFVKSLPKDINCEVKDNDSISQGQKQLLTIARGLLSDAPFLILDEATSSVDTRTEELVQKAMDKLIKGRTSFIIAHRLSTIKNADVILVMKDGNIIEQGNHKKLMAKKGFYYELYNSQFEN